MYHTRIKPSGSALQFIKYIISYAQQWKLHLEYLNQNNSLLTLENWFKEYKWRSLKPHAKYPPLYSSWNNKRVKFLKIKVLDILTTINGRVSVIN